MQSRLANADILPQVKQVALANMRQTRPDELLFVVTVLAVAVAALVFINRVLLGRSIRLTRPTLPTFFLLAYVVLMALPAVVWFYASPADPIRYVYFLAMQSVLVTFPLGMLFANALFADLSTGPRIVRQFHASPLTKSVDDGYASRAWLAMLVAAVAVAAIYLVTSSYVPLIGALTAYGQVAGSIVRSSIFWEGDAMHYAHALTVRLLLPFCLVYAYFMADVYGKRWRILFWCTLAVAAFVSSMTFDRTYPFSVVLFLALAIFFKYQTRLEQRRRGRAARRRPQMMSRLGLAGWMVVMLAASMLVGGLISRVQYNQSLSLEIVRDTAVGFFVDRVLLDASYMAYIYFEEFNSASTFLYGQSLHVLISRFFGVDFYPTISPSFVAELWLNFGWAGVLVGSGLVGFVLQYIQVRFFARKTIPVLSFYVVMLLNGGWIIYGHLLATMVISVYVSGILFIIFLERRRKSSPISPRRLDRRIQYVAAERG